MDNIEIFGKQVRNFIPSELILYNGWSYENACGEKIISRASMKVYVVMWDRVSKYIISSNMMVDRFSNIVVGNWL